jgi:uncharacterized protein (TIGR03437 family)
MLRVLAGLLVCVAAQAATLNTTMTINGTVSSSTTAFVVTGTAVFTGGFAGNGTFSATIPLTALGSGGPTVPVTFTITLSGGTLGGTLQVPLSVLEGTSTSATGSGTITSATGTYAGDTGTFPSLSGSGGIGASGITLTITGSGTITTGGTVTAPPPTITAVLDAASNTPNLAQGTIFIVKGSFLCPGTTLTAFNVPRPTASPDGVSITFTPVAPTTGTATNALLWYEDPLGNGACQLAGILPSSVPVGNYNVTVTNGTTSAAVSVTVVAHKFALFTQDSTGAGLAVAQNVVSATEYDLNRLTTGNIDGTTVSPAHPSQYMVAYGTGLGGVAGDDNAASPVYDFTKNGVTVSVVIGGMNIPVLFAGRAGYAGEDQLNFQLPSNVPTGCTVTFQVSVNGTLSPATTISIAPNGTATACVLPGYTTTQLQNLDNGGTINAGGFSMTQFTETVPGTGTFTSASAGGQFTQISGFELQALATLPGSISTITVGSCTVIQVTLNSTGTVLAGGTVNYLDAGAVTLSGPSGSNLNKTPFTDSNGSYSLLIGEAGVSIPGSVNGTLVAGAYTVAGAGGTGVESFNTSITLGSPLTITGGLPGTVVRSQGLPLTWTGGNSTDVVSIVGYSGTTSGTGAAAVTTASEFICLTTAGTGGFTVSSQVLDQLQATPASTAGGSGFLSVSSGPQPVSFAPTLTAGGGTVASTFSATIGTAGSVIYQ